MAWPVGDRPERAARGPAPSLSREEITTAAVTLADTQTGACGPW
jgi:hypothetical protein